MNIKIGYIFCDAFVVTEEMKYSRPDWVSSVPDNTEGLFPFNLPTPCKISHLVNLYVLPEYRGAKIGQELIDKGLAWMKDVPDVKYMFVYVSNGNNAGTFYERYGFNFSHNVWDGLIEADCKSL